MKQITLLFASLFTLFGAVLPGHAQSCSADYSYVATPTNSNPFQYTFTNTSTALTGSGYYSLDIAEVINSSTTQFLGSVSIGHPNATVTYDFPGPGDYYVSLRMLDSTWGPPLSVCWDTTFYLINVPDPGEIKGYLIAPDTTLVNPAYDYKVWLIQYDSAQDWLYAVDSQSITSSDAGTYYEFIGHPPGFYYVKAHEQSGQLTSNNEVMLPTYHLSELNWANATQIAHGGGTTWAGIQMLAGNNYSGPGFIGGNVSQGANRPTGDGNDAAGVAGLDVFLFDQNNPETLFYTTTDGQGNFSFEDLPFGTYEIYPEALNFSTTPILITINEDNPSSDGNDFEQTSDAILPDGSTGIDATSIAGLKIYPNPVIDQLQIDADAAVKINDIRIWDAQGRPVFHSTQSPATIDLTHLADGFYYLRITNTSGAVQIQKIIKQSR